MLHRFRTARPQVSPDAFVADSADVIGAVTIGPESSVWFQAVLRADHNEIRIGTRSNVQDGAVIHADKPGDGPPVVLGDGVTIGHHVHLHGCEIGDNCLVGSGSIVLDGAVLPPYTLVAVGSIVRPNTTDIPPGQMLMGTPARVFRPINDAEIAYIEGASAAYVKLMQDYRQTEP